MRAYIFLLSQLRGPKSKTPSVAMGAPSTKILVSNTSSPKAGSTLEKWLIPRLGQKTQKVGLEHLLTESAGKTKSPHDGSMQRNTGSS